MAETKIVLYDGTTLNIDGLNFPANIIKKCGSKDEFASFWSFLTEENMKKMHIFENDVETIIMEDYILDGVQATINTDGSINAHFYLKDGQYASVVVDEIAEAEKREVIDKVTKFGGFHTEVVQSDKLGFNWVDEYIGGALLSRTYSEQESIAGTEENPIEYSEETPLIENAFYLKDGVSCVCIDGALTEY